MTRSSSGIAPPGTLVGIDRHGAMPLYRQIYEGYRDAILAARLAPGARLPSTRGLADELEISRLPVLNAFDLLLAEGYCESRVGAGTFVSSALPGKPRPRPGGSGETKELASGSRAPARVCARLARPATPWLGTPGAFHVGDAAFDRFPFAIWRRLVARHARRLDPLLVRYADPLGLLALREAIAAYLGALRGVHCDAGQIMVVSGSQQALSIAARALLDPGSEAWIEEPGYWGAREVLYAAEARPVPVPVDDDGLNVALGIARAPRARAVYVTPSHQFPLGSTLAASRRLQLLEWAQRRGAWIIEDDYDSEYRHDGPPVAALHSLDQNARVIYIGTFSKVLFGALRIGFLVIPADLVPAFVGVRRSMDICPPSFLQAVLSSFIREGHFARHLRRMRVLYRERRSALVSALREELGDTADVRGEKAGMHLVLMLPRGTSDRAVALRAADAGVWAMPLSTCRLGRASLPGLILGYGGADANELRAAVHRLRSVLAPA